MAPKNDPDPLTYVNVIAVFSLESGRGVDSCYPDRLWARPPLLGLRGLTQERQDLTRSGKGELLKCV